MLKAKGVVVAFLHNLGGAIVVHIASLDYLVGNASTVVRDKKILERMEIIADMPEAEQAQIFNVIDALIRDHMAKKAYAS